MKITPEQLKKLVHQQVIKELKEIWGPDIVERFLASLNESPKDEKK